MLYIIQAYCRAEISIYGQTNKLKVMSTLFIEILKKEKPRHQPEQTE